jgi:hypothetical protein
MRQAGINRRPAITMAPAIGNCHPVDTSHDDGPAPAAGAGQGSKKITQP